MSDTETYKCTKCGKIIAPNETFRVLSEAYYNDETNGYERTTDLEIYCSSCSNKMEQI